MKLKIGWLYVEFEFDDVAVLHDVGFAFGAELAGGFDGLFGTVFFEIVVVADLSSDKATLKVGMNGASSFGSGGTFFDGPGATFFFAGGEERLKPQRLVGGFDKLAEGVFFDAVTF